MSGVQPYCQTTLCGCLNNLEALFSCPHPPNIVHWVWFWHKKAPKCNFRGFFIRTKSEYTGLKLDVGSATVLSNYVVWVWKPPGSTVFVPSTSKHGALGVILTQNGSKMQLSGFLHTYKIRIHWVKIGCRECNSIVELRRSGDKTTLKNCFRAPTLQK